MSSSQGSDGKIACLQSAPPRHYTPDGAGPDDFDSEARDVESSNRGQREALKSVESGGHALTITMLTAFHRAIFRRHRPAILGPQC